MKVDELRVRYEANRTREGYWAWRNAGGELAFELRYDTTPYPWPASAFLAWRRKVNE